MLLLRKPGLTWLRYADRAFARVAAPTTAAKHPTARHVHPPTRGHPSAHPNRSRATCPLPIPKHSREPHAIPTDSTWKSAHFDGLLPILARFTTIPIGIISVVVRLFRFETLTRRIRRCCPRAGRVFPLRFARQAIRKTRLLTQPGRVRRRILPTHVNHGLGTATPCGLLEALGPSLAQIGRNPQNSLPSYPSQRRR